MIRLPEIPGMSRRHQVLHRQIPSNGCRNEGSGRASSGLLPPVHPHCAVQCNGLLGAAVGRGKLPFSIIEYLR